MMRRKYIIRNSWTGYWCFNGRRFWTAKGAARKIQKAGAFGSMMELHMLI